MDRLYVNFYMYNDTVWSLNEWNVKINILIMIILCVTKYIWSINYSRIFERFLAVKQKTGSFIFRSIIIELWNWLSLQILSVSGVTSTCKNHPSAGYVLSEGFSLAFPSF